jgi:hypothetical protein
MFAAAAALLLAHQKKKKNMKKIKKQTTASLFSYLPFSLVIFYFTFHLVYLVFIFPFHVFNFFFLPAAPPPPATAAAAAVRSSPPAIMAVAAAAPAKAEASVSPPKAVASAPISSEERPEAGITKKFKALFSAKRTQHAVVAGKPFTIRLRSLPPPCSICGTESGAGRPQAAEPQRALCSRV